MRKLFSILLLSSLSSIALAADAPAEKPPGGSMPGSDKAAGGTMPEASYAANSSCSVDGTWTALIAPNPKMPKGKSVTATFSGGTFTTTTADGKRTSSYAVSNGVVTLSKGSLGTPPKSASDSERSTCDANAAGTYTAVFTTDCSAMKFQVGADSCSQRAHTMEGLTFRRDAK